MGNMLSQRTSKVDVIPVSTVPNTSHTHHTQETHIPHHNVGLFDYEGRLKELHYCYYVSNQVAPIKQIRCSPRTSVDQAKSPTGLRGRRGSYLNDPSSEHVFKSFAEDKFVCFLDKKTSSSKLISDEAN